MSYSDLFHKVAYVNKDDPTFVPGASPAISAENLNAQQDGIAHALAAADTIAADISKCQTDIETLNECVIGVAYRHQYDNITVPTTAWIEDTPYEKYPFKAVLDMPDATATMTPEVIFSLLDAASGLLAPVAETLNGHVVLYATEVPLADILIPTVLLWHNN